MSFLGLTEKVTGCVLDEDVVVFAFLVAGFSQFMRNLMRQEAERRVNESKDHSKLN